MPGVVVADRAIASVIATAGEDWQIVSTPVGFQGITSANFSDNDKTAGFVIFEDGENWEVYDTDDDTDTALLEIANITGTVTITRPATPYASSNGGSRVTAGSGTHTLVIGMGAGTAKRILRETNPTIQTFTSGDATPSVQNYRFFKTNGSTAITAFDDMHGGQLFWVRRGDADIVITHGASIVLPGSANITLTEANPTAVFWEEAGVAYWVGGSTSTVLRGGGTLTIDGNQEITVSHGNKYQLPTSGTISGVIGLGDGEFVDLFPPASGSVTIEDEGATTAGQQIKNSGMDKLVNADTDEGILRLYGNGTNVFIGGGGQGGIERVADVSTLIASAGSVAGQMRLVTGSRQGLFEWDSSDLSTEVAYETASNEGVYYAPTSDATGASGAWVRQAFINQPYVVRAEWFGATGDGTTDDSTALQAMLDFVDNYTITNQRAKSMRMELSTYYVAQALTINTGNFALVGVGGRHAAGLILSSTSTDPLLKVGSDTYANQVYNVRIDNLGFYTSQPTINNIALQLHDVITARINGCEFQDFYKGIEGFRFNSSYITDNIFRSTSRVNANKGYACIRLAGRSTDGSTSGNNVMQGNRNFAVGGTISNPLWTYCVSVESADGLYSAGNHWYFADYGMRIWGSDTNVSDFADSVMCVVDYYDTNTVSCVQIDGQFDNIRNISFVNCMIRNSNDRGVAIFPDNNTGASSDFEQIRFIGCSISKHQGNGITMNNTNGDIKELKIIDCDFEENNGANGSGKGDIALIALNAQIMGNTFRNEGTANDFALQLQGNCKGTIVTGNNFRQANATESIDNNSSHPETLIIKDNQGVLGDYDAGEKDFIFSYEVDSSGGNQTDTVYSFVSRTDTAYLCDLHMTFVPDDQTAGTTYHLRTLMRNDSGTLTKDLTGGDSIIDSKAGADSATANWGGDIGVAGTTVEFKVQTPQTLNSGGATGGRWLVHINITSFEIA